MRNKTDKILKKAAHEFELMTGSGSWSTVASALQGIERRGMVFQWGAFVSVFLLLMFAGKYLNPNETVTKETTGNRQLAGSQNMATANPVVIAHDKSVVQPSIELDGQASFLHAIEPPQFHKTTLPQVAPSFEAGILPAIKPAPTCEKPKKCGPNKKLTWEVVGGVGMSYRTVFGHGGTIQTFSNSPQPGMPKHSPTTFVSVGATVGKHLNKNWNIATGLWLSKYGYDIYDRNTHMTGSTLLGQYASYRIEIPLLADYKLKMGNLKLELRQGIVPALTVVQKSPLADNYAYYSDNNRTPRFQLAALFNPRLKFRVGKAELLAGPEVRYSLTNSYPNKQLLKEHLWSASVNLGLRWRM